MAGKSKPKNGMNGKTKNGFHHHYYENGHISKVNLKLFKLKQEKESLLLFIIKHGVS
jgi:hypothetical protein